MSENTLRDPELLLTPSVVAVTLLERAGIRATGKLDVALHAALDHEAEEDPEG